MSGFKDGNLKHMLRFISLAAWLVAMREVLSSFIKSFKIVGELAVKCAQRIFYMFPGPLRSQEEPPIRQAARKPSRTQWPVTALEPVCFFQEV